MSGLLYHALWVAIALLAAALASALLTRRAARLALRRDCARQALEALARQCEWLAAQRRNPGFDGEPRGASAPLGVLLRCQAQALPELATGTSALLQVHGRAIDFLWRQQLLRLRDPEAWLDSDHDRRFMDLWQDHQAAVQGLAEQLRAVAGSVEQDPEPEFVFPT